MNIQFKFILEPYKGPSSRYRCPCCGHKNKFSRYIDSETNEPLADHAGRCDREDNCGYHYTPKQFFTDNPDKKTADPSSFQPLCKADEQISKPVATLPIELLDKSVSDCKRSSFFQGLSKLVPEENAVELCQNYFVGTSKEGHTAFWQVDISGNVRQCKVMQYDPMTLKRNKETGATLFVGKKILNDNEANLQQCYFGEFLLSFPENENKPVAIVESEKTALLSSMYYPDFVWIATGGKNGAKWTESRTSKVLADRNVILFPDLGAFEAWEARGKLLEAVAHCKVITSDVLEKNATIEDKQKGLDLADYLVRRDDRYGWALSDHGYPLFWDVRR